MRPDEDDRQVLETDEDLESKLLDLTNEVRVQNGRTPLRHNSALAAAARKQAKRCADAGKLSHDLGGPLGTRVKAEGYRFAVVGENLAKRFPPADNILKGWLNSPGHKRNLLGSKFTETGVGITKVGRFAYACAIYAKPLRAGLEDDPTVLEVSSLVLDEDTDTAETEQE